MSAADANTFNTEITMTDQSSLAPIDSRQQGAIARKAADGLEGAAMDGYDVADLEELFDVPAPLAAAFNEYRQAWDEYTEDIVDDLGLGCIRSRDGELLFPRLVQAVENGDNAAVLAVGAELRGLVFGAQLWDRDTPEAIAAWTRAEQAEQRQREEREARREAIRKKLAAACRGWSDAEEAGPLLNNLVLLSCGGLGILHVSTAKHWHHRAIELVMEDGIPAEQIRKYITTTTSGALDAGAIAALKEYDRTRDGGDKKAAARARKWVQLHLYAHYSRWGSNAPAETVLEDAE